MSNLEGGSEVSVMMNMKAILSSLKDWYMRQDVYVRYSLVVLAVLGFVLAERLWSLSWL